MFIKSIIPGTTAPRVLFFIRLFLLPSFFSFLYYFVSSFWILWNVVVKILKFQ